MATGDKLPNSGVNLINSADVVDVGDLNAISQALEKSATELKAFPIRLNSDNLLEVADLPAGIGDGTNEYFYALSSGTYRSSPTSSFTGAPFGYGFYTIYHVDKNDMVVVGIDISNADTYIARANANYVGALKWTKVYHSGNFLSESSGDSHYSLHPDGDLKCWGTFTPVNPIIAGIGSSGLFRSNSEEIIFKRAFKDANYSLSLTIANPTVDTESFATTVQVYAKSVKSFSLFSVNPKSVTTPVHKIEWQAIGRWK